jgi:hypothetical protein
MPEPVTDAGIGAALGVGGAYSTITHAGKVWTLGKPTQKAKHELELLVVQVAQNNIDDLKSVLSPQRYEAKCAKLDGEIEAGNYKTWGSLWLAVNASPLGQPLFLASLLKEKHQEATLADAQAMWRDEPRQVYRAMRITVPDFFTVLTESLPLSPAQRARMKVEQEKSFMELLDQMQSAFTESVDSKESTTS